MKRGATAPHEAQASEAACMTGKTGNIRKTGKTGKAGNAGKTGKTGNIMRGGMGILCGEGWEY